MCTFTDSVLSDASSIGRPLKVSRLGDTPPLLKERAAAETPNLRRSRRTTTATAVARAEH